MEFTAEIRLVRLKEGHSIVEAAFSEAFRESLAVTALCAGYDGGHHAVFQCADETDLLAIVGYHNHEYPDADKLSSRIFELLTNVELLNVKLEAVQLALDSESIAILFSESQPADADSLPGKGDWSVSVPEGVNDHASEQTKRTWVHIVTSEDADRLSQIGPIKRFSKVMESRIVSQDAE
ncbi:hypothetical protein ANO14919_106630 [Xylariales sp. No.14919]|nr:hypothetical protein F5X98DRAFT_225554 [Xylaria grammica]GAW21146.1 hypothetical protein ANO14919_106630 [Xylariales sp. No.14919]